MRNTASNKKEHNINIIEDKINTRFLLARFLLPISIVCTRHFLLRFVHLVADVRGQPLLEARAQAGLHVAVQRPLVLLQAGPVVAERRLVLVHEGRQPADLLAKGKRHLK